VEDGAGEELAQPVVAPADVAADEIGVGRLEIAGQRRVAVENAVTEARREALDLILDGRRHVGLGAVGDVAVERVMDL